MKKEFQIDGTEGLPICFDLNMPEKPKGVCVFLHGFKGFKDWGMFNEISEHFVANNFAFLKLNFSHNGCTPQYLSDFVDLDAFGKNRYSYELKDLMLVLDWINSREDLHQLPIHIIGHSRGAGIAILGAAQDSRISSITSWASVYDYYDRFVPDLDSWKEGGVIYTRNGRTKQDMPLYFSFYEDYLENKHLLDIPYWVKKITKPFLIVHGTEDKAVLVDDAFKLQLENPNAILFIVPEGDHTFGAKHPSVLDKFPNDLQRVVDKTLNFISSSKS